MRGEVVNLKVYQRVVEEHEIMRKWDAIGLSERILLKLKKSGVHVIRFILISKTRPTSCFLTTVSAFLSSNLKHTYIQDDLQLFVPIRELVMQNIERQQTFKEVT